MQIVGVAARLGNEPHLDVSHLPGGIFPIARIDAGECGPQGLRHLPHGHAERARDAAVEVHLELGLLSLRRQAHVDRARSAEHDLLHLQEAPAVLQAPQEQQEQQGHHQRGFDDREPTARRRGPERRT